MKKHLLFLALLLFAATSTWALTPVYVNGSTGNNSYDGSSAIVGTFPIGPKLTIQAGIDAASVAGTVNIAAGIYQESKGGGRDIELFKSLSLIGAGSGQTIVQFSNLQIGFDIRGTNASIWIEGITFTKRTANANSAQWAVKVEDYGVYSSFNSLIFKDVEIAYASARNLYFGNANYTSISVENCNIHHASNPTSAVWGCSLRGTVTSMTITDSHFDYNGTGANNGIGFDIDNPTVINSIQVTGGTFNYNTYKGINLVKTTHASFTGISASNNSGASAGGFGVCLWEFVSASSDLVFNNCALNSNSTNGILLGTEGTCSISNLQIIGGTVNGNGSRGIYYYNASNYSSISNVTVNGVSFTGNREAIDIQGKVTSVINNANILNNIVGSGTAGNGVLLSYHNNCTVSGNNVSGRTASNGIAVLNTTGLTMNGNTAENNFASGIVMVNCTTANLQGNTLRYNTGNPANPGGLTIRENCNGVNATNNVIEGNTIGLWVSATNVSGVAATGNSFAGNSTYGLQNNSVNLVTATCNWWGSTIPATIASKIVGPVTYIPYNISDGGACTGIPPVLVKRSGVIISGYTTIQAAISATTTLNSDEITVAAGTYAGNINVNKSLTIIGDPGDALPGPGVNAPVIDGGSAPGDAFLLANGVTNVTIKGFEMRNFTSPELDGIGNGISAWVGSTSNITIQDNYFHHLGYNGVLVGNDYSSNPANWGDHTNWLIKNNIINNFGYIGFELTNTSTSSIEGNEIHMSTPYIGAIFSSARRSETALTIKNNQIDGTPSTGYPVIYIYAYDLDMPNPNLNNVLIEGNVIASVGTPFQIYIRNIGTGTITGVQAHSNNLTAFKNLTSVQINATSNYWGGCPKPKISGSATYYPYYTTCTGTAGSLVLGGLINNIVASASASPVCAGSSTTIYATGGSDYVWDNGLGSGATKVVTPTVNPTTYSVTATDAYGCTGAFASVSVAITPAPTVIITPSSGNTLLTASGATTYLWSTGATTAAITVSPSVFATYTVTGTTGTCTGTASYTVAVANAGSNQYICYGSSANLNATLTGATATAYAWTPVTGLSNPAIQNPVASPTVTTTYTVSITATNGPYSASVTVFVKLTPTANAGPDITICSSGSGTLSGSATGGATPYAYAWTGPSSFTSTLPNPTVTLAGTYTLVVTGSNGCSSAADNAVVTIETLPTYAVTGNVSYYNTLNPQMHNVTITLKQGGATKYTAVTPASGNGDYSFPGVLPGTYDVVFSLPTAWGGVTTLDIVAIQKHYMPPQVYLTGLKRLAADVVDNSTDAIVVAADRDAVNNKRLNPTNPTYNFATGNWVFVKAADVLTNTTPFHYANSAGTSNIQITIVATAVTQDFKSLCYGDVDASNSCYKDLEGLDVTSTNGLQFGSYPNPFSGQTTLTYALPVDGNVEIAIYNILGRQVANISKPQQTENTYEVKWDATGLSKGVYIAVLTLRTGDDVLRQQIKMILNR